MCYGEKTKTMLLMLFIGFGFSVGSTAATDNQQLPKSVCTSEPCQNVARDIISTMDPTVDPCVDFYAYACNRWNASDTYDYGQFGVLLAKIPGQLQELFESRNSSNPTEKKAIDIYNQCTNRTHDTAPGFRYQTLLRTVDEMLGGWSLLDAHANVTAFLLEDTLIRLQQNNIQTFGLLYVADDVVSGDEQILYLMAPERFVQRAARWEPSALENAHVNNTINNTFVKLYRAWVPFVQSLIDATNTSVQWSTVESRLQGAIMLEAVLNAGATGDLDGSKRITFRDLSTAPYRSQFLANFLPLFNAMLRASKVNFQATTATTLGDTRTAYLLHLDKTMAQLEAQGNAGRATMADWLWWSAVHHYLNQRTDQCVKLVKEAMPLTVSGMFLKAYIPDSALQRAKALTSELAKGVRDAVLLKADWMDRVTQDAAVDKLNHTLRMVGYPEDFLRNWTILDKLYAKIEIRTAFSDTLRTIDQSNSWLNLGKLMINPRNNPYYPTDLTSANAVMILYRNYLVIPAGDIQPPMLYAGNLDIVNYARLGVSIGHELIHGFDEFGKNFGIDGKTFNWWTNATQSNYNARKYALVGFYNNMSTPNNSVDGRQTFNENIADIDGVRAAYLAFHNFMSRTGYRIKLPGLEELTEDQLFWLIAAQVTFVPLVKLGAAAATLNRKSQF